ncbi:toprim domain-containing protein (plasmid) [Iamia sp. SCSIO 61187]|uniref:toprim domain-containing protein n=1 Tax=Iamia sp. SCSIO 61187 TaxID=2722752 RepID=UPI001C62E419|nr:toprim domain-containing protein [Iamia sp. SCSIO 61187]QYG94390.1 toprim domain-containing protein [Iamia sp. SCSIO 61187]QYG95797.1 toprim domain-containing protein [Iamia sp. SCSIO 61187]
MRSAFDYLAARAGQRPDDALVGPAHRPPGRRCERDPEGLARYARECAATLWTPAGAPILRWLTDERGLPEDVLRVNEIGADTGSRRQFRPDGMPRAAGAVLPTIVDGQPIYAHIRVMRPGPDRTRYLNPAYDLAPSPRMCRYEPARRLHDEIVITEGAIDGLSAAAAGYVAVPFFGTGCPDASHALALARLPGPLVMAFDPEEGKGQRSAAHLRALLAAHQRTALNVRPPDGDLNECLLAGDDWPQRFEAAIADARRAETIGRSLAG